MTLHLFEGPVHGPVCYCVPGGAASCATCRERRARADEEDALVREADEVSADEAMSIWIARDHPGQDAIDALVSDFKRAVGPHTKRVSDWIERFTKAREKALAEGWLKGVDVAEQDGDKTVIWHTSVGPWQRSGPKTATEVREQQRAAEIACKECGDEPE